MATLNDIEARAALARLTPDEYAGLVAFADQLTIPLIDGRIPDEHLPTVLTTWRLFTLPQTT